MSSNPDSRTPEWGEVFREFFNYYLDDLWTAMPGKITAYDPKNQKVDVQPMINRLIKTEDGEDFKEEFPILPDVPVYFPRSGGFSITLPIAVGDFVLLVFNQRSIDEYVSGDGSSPVDPDDFRLQDMNDAVALPGFFPYSKALSRNADTEDMVLGHNSGAGVGFFKQEQVHFGKKQAADSATLESKVQAELNALRTTLNSLIIAYNSHIHVTTATIGPTGILGTITPTPAQATAPAPINPTLSDVVKIDK